MKAIFIGILLVLLVDWSISAPSDEDSLLAEVQFEMDEIDYILASKKQSHLKNATHAGNSTTDEDTWLGQCEELSHDLLNAWNLTCRICSRSIDVLEKLGSTTYDIINCNKTILNVPVVPIECIVNNLKVLKSIIDPAVVEGYHFAKEAMHMVPGTWRDWKKCILG